MNVVLTEISSQTLEKMTSVTFHICFATLFYVVFPALTFRFKNDAIDSSKNLRLQSTNKINLLPVSFFWSKSIPKQYYSFILNVNFWTRLDFTNPLYESSSTMICMVFYYFQSKLNSIITMNLEEGVSRYIKYHLISSLC